MAISCVGHILGCLNKPSLINLCDERLLNRYGNKSTLHHRLRSSFRNNPVELLSFLNKTNLREVAKNFEVNISGNKDDLIHNIIESELCKPSKSDEIDESDWDEEIDDWDEGSDDSEEENDSNWLGEEPSDLKLYLPHRYKKLGSIGKGGFGEAFLCEDVELKRKIVIKKPNTEHLHSVLREARVQAQFQNQNIVSIYDIDETHSFITMEYCSGGNLWARLRDGNLKDYEIKQLIHGTCNGLKAIHEKNIVHKDIGPHNIFYNNRGNVKIGDFGISQSMNTLNTAIGFHSIFRAPVEYESSGSCYDMYTLGQTIVSCWIGIPDQPINRTDLPEKHKVNDKLIWVIAWLLLAEAPEKNITADEVLTLIDD